MSAQFQQGAAGPGSERAWGLPGAAHSLPRSLPSWAHRAEPRRSAQGKKQELRPGLGIYQETAGGPPQTLGPLSTSLPNAVGTGSESESPGVNLRIERCSCRTAQEFLNQPSSPSPQRQGEGEKGLSGSSWLVREFRMSHGCQDGQDPPCVDAPYLDPGPTWPQPA